MVWEGLEDIGGGWMGGWEGSLSRPVSSNGKDDGGGGGGEGLSKGVSWGHTGQRHTTLKYGGRKLEMGARRNVIVVLVPVVGLDIDYWY